MTVLVVKITADVFEAKVAKSNPAKANRSMDAGFFTAEQDLGQPFF